MSAGASSVRASSRRLPALSVMLLTFVCGNVVNAADSGTAVRAYLESVAGNEQTGIDWTFGQPFRSGDVRADSTLHATLDDGSRVGAQLDVKSTYPDGSVRFGVVTVRVSRLKARSRSTLVLRPVGSELDTSVVVPQDLLNTEFEFETTITVEGQTYRVSARELLLSGPLKSWLRGELVSEWLVGGPLVDEDGQQHPHLALYYHIRAYSGSPMRRARVDVIVENGWARVAAPRNFTYDVKIRVGTETKFEQSGLTHYQHARWHRTLWWGEEPKVRVTHDPVYLQATKASPRYASIEPSRRTIDSLPQERPEPMENLDLHNRLGSPGAAPWIGPMPKWDTLYAATGGSRALEAVMAYADAWSAYPVHYRDEKTGRPINISAPGNSFAGLPGAGRGDFPKPVGQSTPYGWKSSHSPPAGFMAYLVSGDYYYLEQLQFVANQNLLQEITVGSKRYPSTWPRVIHSRQVRAQAWTLRTLGLAARFSPDDDPLADYFASVIHENLRYLNNLYPGNNSLGLIVRENIAFQYDTIGKNTGFAPWQHAFYTFSIGRLVELGFEEALPLFDFLSTWYRGALLDPSYCWVFAVNYTVGVRPSEHEPLFGSFGELYEANIPVETRRMECGSREQANAIGKPFGAFNDFLESPTSYQANQQPAVAMMATLDVGGGKAAWDLISTRTHRPKFDDYPNFAVVPR